MTYPRFLQLLPAVLLFLAGLGMAWQGSSYRVGSLTAMGPGFMPVALGLCLALFALLLCRLDRQPVAAGDSKLLRPVSCIVVGMVVWALLVDRVGFMAAGLAQVLLSSLALPIHQWQRLLIGSVLLVLASYLLFVQLLGLPLAAFGS